MLPPCLSQAQVGWWHSSLLLLAACILVACIVCCAVLCRVATVVVVIVVALAPPEWTRFSTLTNTSFLHSVFTAAGAVLSPTMRSKAWR